MQIFSSIFKKLHQNENCIEGSIYAIGASIVLQEESEIDHSLYVLSISVHTERCRTLLAQDLGVEPTAETKALYEAITQQVQEGKEPESLITLSAPVILHHFPTQLSAFFGRESELNKIQKKLLDPDCRLLTLIGMGGVGKTRLCIQAAQLIDIQDHFRDGIYFFPLTATNTADALLTKLANGLGITFDGRDDPWLQIRDFLRDRYCLLVLDNFEQLVDSAPNLAEILGAAPDVQLLVTSRRPLNLRLERRLTIEGLSFPPVDQPLTDILSYSAVQLFVETARHGASGFSLSAENEADVGHICQNVQGIPLALEMAASWTSLMNCAAIAAEINRNLDFLTSRHQDLPERHRNLRAVFSASFDQLSPSQQATLAKFSVFRGPVDLEAILAITEVTMGDVAHLLDMTLLRTTHQGRYELHELLRQFAAEKLVELETADKSKGETAARHSSYYLAFIARHEARLYGLESADAQKLLLDQLDNIEAAWQWAVEAGHLQELLTALEGLSYFYELSTLFQRAATVFSQAVQHLIQTRETAEAVDLSLTSVLCQVQVHQAYFFDLCGEIDNAFQAVESALKFSRNQSYSQGEADALSLLGNFLPHRGQFELGIQYLEQAISYYETVDQERSLAIALNRLGIVNWRHARYEPALEAFFRALDIFQSLGDKLRLARLHDTIAGVYWEKRERDKTMVYTQKGLALFESTGNKIGIATILAHLALIHTALGQFNLALEHSEKSIAICREVGNRYNLSIDLGNRASIYEAMGNFEQALVHYEEALKIDKALGDEWRIAYHRSGITYSLMQLGRYEEALNCLDQAVPVLKAHGARYYAVEPMINMAQIYFIQKRNDLVRPLVEEAQALARELNIRHSHLEGDILLAKLDFVAGQEQRAIEQLETLLAETQDENEQGQLHYELWKMGGESFHQQAAIQLYKAAYQRVPNYENKTRLVELEGDLSNQKPV